jgi:nucleoid-associated protein YgaU
LTTEHTFARVPEQMFDRIRILILPATALLVAAALSAGFSEPAASRSAIPPRHADAAAARYVVQPGDTVWAIAERRYADQDPRKAVQLIDDANDLEGAVLQPGEVLVLP